MTNGKKDSTGVDTIGGRPPSESGQEAFSGLVNWMAVELKDKFKEEQAEWESVRYNSIPEIVQFTQTAFVYGGEDEWREIFLQTLHSIITGQIYSRVKEEEKQPPWPENPVFEKMLIDNSRLPALLLTAYQLTGDTDLRGSAQDVLNNLEGNLYLPQLKGWGLPGDMQQKSYFFSLESALKKSINNTSRLHVTWNAFTAHSLFQSSTYLAEPHWYNLALQTVHMLMENCYNPSKGMAGFWDTESKNPGEWGLLENQVSAGLALNAAFQHSGDKKWLELSRKLAEYCLKNLSPGKGRMRRGDPGGKRTKDDESLEVLSNSLCARWFVELSALTGEEAYLEKSSDIIRSFQEELMEQPFKGVGMFLAAFETREQEVVIDVVGYPEAPGLLPLHSTALAAVMPPKVVRIMDPRQAGAVNSDYEGVEEATAFVNLGKRRYYPVHSPDKLREVMKEAVMERRAETLFS